MPERYEPAEIEPKWRARWQEADLFVTREEAGKPKFYGLDFFPYPSGAGLSVGHCRNYVPTDVICRAKRMQGHNVLHPMGFDAFGLPAENEAIKRKRHPSEMIEEYAANYKRQMDLIGISYDWSRTFKSSEPSYYRWTQWIFLKLYEKGLAYRADAPVNWCPKDKTALANEEVVGGLCERCGTPVEKRNIPQWYFRITAYAQRLIDDLDGLDWPEGIKHMQRNWIGRSEGVEFDLKVSGPGIAATDHAVYDLGDDSAGEKPLSFRVFTTRIDTVFGMTFCVLAPEHPLVEKLLALAPADRAEAMRTYRAEAARMGDATRAAEGREKTGVDTGFRAVNPANGNLVPIFLADYVMMGYGTGAIMAVPGHDQRDFDFARKYGLEILPVIAPAADAEAEVLAMHESGRAFETKDGVLIHSGEYSGQSVADAQKALGIWIEALGIGQRTVNYKLRDWLISRQRYWGCPIPIIHSAEGLEQAISESDLPVLLPDVEHYEPAEDGSSPLSRIEDFVRVTDRDGRLGRRETDTMGGFACSSWYFLRFCDPFNDEAAWDPEKIAAWMPVDCYVGGAEHAVMHLLYARFWTKVLYDLGLVPVQEPFQRLVNQGQVLGNTPYRKPRGEERLDVGEDGILVSYEEAKGMPAEDLTWKWVRMSKSKGNVVTPDEMVAEYGADALRVFELFVAPFDADVQWKSEGVQGSVRFLARASKFAFDVRPTWHSDWRGRIGLCELSADARTVRRATHQMIAKAQEDIDRFAMNTYISAMMIFLNTVTPLVKNAAGDESLQLALSEAAESFTLVLSPVAPHLADEMWVEDLQLPGFTLDAQWPTFDPALAKEDLVTIAVQVNGKLRDDFQVAVGTPNHELEVAARALPKIQAYLESGTVRKVIVVPGKLVNFVVA